nr:hypothetical protein 5 [bacterium]
MSKKQAYFAIAEKMFTEEQIPITGIAERLDITEKTLRAWRDEGSWEKKKAQIMKSSQSCHAELYKLVEKLTTQMTDEIEAGGSPDGAKLYFVSKMIDKLPKLKAYEETANEKQESKISTEDLVSKVNNLLGI